MSNITDAYKDNVFIPDVSGSDNRKIIEQACVVPLSKACSPVATYHCYFNMENEKKDWFRLKKYPHIGLPLKLRHRGWVEEYVTNPNNIKNHSFYPFIHRKLSVRKYRRKKNQDGTKSAERIIDYKVREVFYANHLDSMIYSYYSEILTKEYEKLIRETSLSSCITAYRSIPLSEDYNSRNKCNIDFANDVFSYIQNSRNSNLVAITFDITAFFDNLNHLKLKDSWCKLLNLERLPDDHYAVYKNLTKFSYIEFDDIFENLKHEILVENKGKISPSSIPRADLMKEKNAISFCHLKDFELKIRKKNLVKSNKFSSKDDFEKKISRLKGIPQGSPISASLANIYLHDFDKLVNVIVSEFGGIYRRYSDDMVVVADEKYKDNIYQLLTDNIKRFDLEIQPNKTQIFYFKNFNGKYGCKELNIYTEKLSDNTKFDYLGFSFDGEHVYLKSAGLSKYYRKMKRSVKRGGFYAKYGRNQVPKLFKNRLYKRYTLLGAERKMIVKKVPNLPNTFIKTGEYDWGNFLTYALLATRVFPQNKIRSQIRNHWNKFHKIMKAKEIEIESHYLKKDKK